MWKASFIYLTGFTIANIISAIYLKSAVTRYKKDYNSLPKWAKSSRAFLDNLDDSIKPYEVEEVDAAIKEIGKVFDFFKIKEFSSMPFLQIRANKDNMYDVRDDYEFGRATKNLDKSRAKKEEFKRETEAANNPLGNINEELFEASKDDPNVDVEAPKDYKDVRPKFKTTDIIGNELDSINKEE